MKSLLISVVLVMLFFSTSNALAQSVFFLSERGDKNFINDEDKEALKGIKEAFNLNGIRIVSSSDLKTHLSNSLVKCDFDESCTQKVFEATHAQMLTSVSFWKYEEEDENIHQIAIGLLTKDGGRYEVSVTRQDNESPFKLGQRAVKKVLKKKNFGQGPYLELVGFPIGAEIFLDGNNIGRLPLFEKVKAGQHEVSVMESGYQSQEIKIEIEDDVAKTFKIQVDLKKGKISAENMARLSEQRSSQDDLKMNDDDLASSSSSSYWAAGSLALGAALLVRPVMTLMQEGEYRKKTELGYREKVEMQTLDYLLLGAGALAIGTGVTLFILPSGEKNQEASYYLNYQTKF